MQNLVGYHQKFDFIPPIKLTIIPRHGRKLPEDGLLSVPPGCRRSDVAFTPAVTTEFWELLCARHPGVTRGSYPKLTLHASVYTHILAQVCTFWLFLVLKWNHITCNTLQLTFFHLAIYHGHLYQLGDRIRSECNLVFLLAQASSVHVPQPHAAIILSFSFLQIYIVEKPWHEVTSVTLKTHSTGVCIKLFFSQ